MKTLLVVLLAIGIAGSSALGYYFSRPSSQKQAVTEKSPEKEAVVSPAPAKITPLVSPTPPAEPIPQPSDSNLLQAAIEISCFLSQNAPDTPGIEGIYQKYGVTLQQVSDYHRQAYQKTLPSSEQAQFEAGIKNCP